jgi:hypothetical protein
MTGKKRSKSNNLTVAMRSFWAALTQPGFVEQVEPLIVTGKPGILSRPALPPPATPQQTAPTPTSQKEAPKRAPAASPVPPKPSNEALRLLTLMQRDGRLVDFLMEDIGALPDAQIGAAVRDIHRTCRKVLEEHVALEAVVPQNEDETINVEKGFDPSAIRLSGNIGGEPPYKGVVTHRGWKLKELKLPPVPTGQNAAIIAPAEVEVT